MVLFLHGADSYRSKRKLDEIRAKFLRDIDPSGLNLVQIDGTEAGIDAIRAAMSSAPFLAKRRMVVLKDAIVTAGKKDGEALAELLDAVPDDTILVIHERVGAEALADAPAYAKLKAGKFYPEFLPLGPKDLQSWILAEAKLRGVAFSKEALAAYLPLAGTDGWKISGELDAMAATARAVGGDIEVETVRSLAHLHVEQSIFDFLDAIGSRRPEAAVRMFEALLEQGETEVSILSRIQGHIRGLLVAADMAANGQITKDRLARELGVHPYVAAKLVSQSRYYRLEELKRLFVRLVDFDERLKKGGWPQPRMAVDAFVADIVAA